MSQQNVTKPVVTKKTNCHTKTSSHKKNITQNGVVTRRPLGTLCGWPQAPRRRRWPSRPGLHPILSGPIAVLFIVVLKSGWGGLLQIIWQASKQSRTQSQRAQQASTASKQNKTQPAQSRRALASKRTTYVYIDICIHSKSCIVSGALITNVGSNAVVPGLACVLVSRACGYSHTYLHR